MASPHVAGVAALLKSAYPSLTPADVQDLLKTTGSCPNGQLADADGTGTCAGKGQWGNDPDGIAEPLVNALNAVAGGTPGDRRPTVHITSPAGGAAVSGVVSVTATATDDVGVTRVEFLVNGRLVATDTNGADGWSTTWDASAVDGGYYTFTATRGRHREPGLHERDHRQDRRQRPGQLGRDVRARRLRARELERRRQHGRRLAAGRRDVQPRSGLALPLGLADDGRPCPPGAGPDRSSGDDLV